MWCYLPLKQISDRTLQPRFCVHRIPVGQTLSFLVAPWTATKYSSPYLHPPSPSNAFQYSSRLVAVSLTCLRAIEIKKVPKFQRWHHQSENKRKG